MTIKKQGRILLLVLGVMVATICMAIYFSDATIRYDHAFTHSNKTEFEK